MVHKLDFFGKKYKMLCFCGTKTFSLFSLYFLVNFLCYQHEDWYILSTELRIQSKHLSNFRWTFFATNMRTGFCFTYGAEDTEQAPLSTRAAVKWLTTDCYVVEPSLYLNRILANQKNSKTLPQSTKHTTTEQKTAWFWTNLQIT